MTATTTASDTGNVKTDSKTFTGACHCRAVTYKITLPTDHPKTAVRCNCTFCQVPNFVNLRLPRKDCFTLLTPASRSSPPLSDYQVLETSPDIHRYFCQVCGTHVFRDIHRTVRIDSRDITVDFLTVNLSTLDQPQEGLELSEWKYEYLDGRTGSFAKGTKAEPWKSSLI